MCRRLAFPCPAATTREPPCSGTTTHRVWEDPLHCEDPGEFILRREAFWALPDKYCIFGEWERERASERGREELRDECCWLSVTGESGEEVDLRVTWYVENKELPSFVATCEVANGKAPHNGHPARANPGTQQVRLERGHREEV